MGVHGLTTYLRENKRALSKTHNFPSKNSPPTIIVVDGWSFIYDLHYNSNLPWVYGGQYREFSHLITSIVRAWIDVGLKVYFVFDGAYPQLKFSTLVSRLAQSHIQPSLLFFRTSTTSRGSKRFLNESRIIPPLSYAACVQALEAVRQGTDAIGIHFADEEGDPYAVELAGRVGGYVVGNDSDFVVLNSEGYRGYVPLDELIWIAPATENNSELASEDDDDFQPVRNSKSKQKTVRDPKLGRGLIPPEVTSGLTLSFTAYTPSALASHLNLPVTLLPLLGALVGNDFSSRSASGFRDVQSLFFQRHTTATQRINHVAATMQTILSAASHKRKQKHQVGSVMDLIDKTVNALLARSVSTMGSGEINAIVERIVESTLPYAIPKYDGEIPGQESLWVTEVCALHEPDLCPILPMLSRMVAAEALATGEETVGFLTRNRLRALYLEAYRKGRFSPKMMDILHTATYWPRLFLECPDTETVGCSVGQPIRQWIYSILHDAVGLPDIEDIADNRSIEREPPTTECDDSGDDELIDVVEDQSDEDSRDLDDGALIPLRQALQQLDGAESPRPPKASPSMDTQPPASPVIIEYLRRGTHVARECVVVTQLPDLLSSISITDYGTQTATPLLLRSEQERLTVFLRAVKSDVSSVRDLPPEQLVPALTLRWVLQTFRDRAEENGSKEREQERWTRQEARYFLASFSWTNSAGDTALPQVDEALPPVVDRNIQLVAQILSAIETIEELSQVLLLSECVPPVAHQFSGRSFHSYLTGRPVVDNAVPVELWHVCELGLEDAFGEDRTKKSKKARAKTKSVVAQQKGIKSSASNGGFFEILLGAEAEA